MKRRTFLQQSLVYAGAVSFNPFPYHQFISDKKKYASDLVTLGNTGIQLTRLGMGTGTKGGEWGSSNQTRKLGVKGLADLLHLAYDNGVMFWDTADQYGSYPHLKEALKHVPRDKIVILTKTHATTEKEMKVDLDRFRQELGTDYLDIVLLHKLRTADWPTTKKPGMEVLSQAREDGIIRAHGISCHGLEPLKTAAKTDWVQVELARFNPGGAMMDADMPAVREILREMKSRGKGIIGMKVLGAGRLPGRIDECLQFQLGSEFVDCFTIGQESVDQFHDLQKRIPAASIRG